MAIFKRMLVAIAVLLAGCASISIEQPKDQSVVARLPQKFDVTVKRFVTFGDTRLDGFVLSSQGYPGGTLNYVPPGPHTLEVPAKDSKWGNDISKASRFTVNQCPLCYVCPAPAVVHPITGQCCESGVCDRPVFANFGVALNGTVKCQQAVFPSTSPRYWYEFDCIGVQAEAVRGPSTGGSPPPQQQMIAVSFTPNGNGALRHLRVPVGLRGGTNSLSIWVTADNGNSPGTVLEHKSAAVRAQPTATGAYPAVESPEHIFFGGSTQLTAGNKYWLVLGPGAADTAIVWNLALDDFSIPNTTTLLLNRTFTTITPTSLSGTWMPKSNLAELRPAFELDMR